MTALVPSVKSEEISKCFHRSSFKNILKYLRYRYYEVKTCKTIRRPMKNMNIISQTIK
jgi:hypothetical protein